MLLLSEGTEVEDIISFSHSGKSYLTTYKIRFHKKKIQLQNQKKKQNLCIKTNNC